MFVQKNCSEKLFRKTCAGKSLCRKKPVQEKACAAKTCAAEMSVQEKACAVKKAGGTRRRERRRNG